MSTQKTNSLSCQCLLTINRVLMTWLTLLRKFIGYLTALGSLQSVNLAYPEPKFYKLLLSRYLWWRLLEDLGTETIFTQKVIPSIRIFRAWLVQFTSQLCFKCSWISCRLSSCFKEKNQSTYVSAIVVCMKSGFMQLQSCLQRSQSCSSFHLCSIWCFSSL